MNRILLALSLYLFMSLPTFAGIIYTFDPTHTYVIWRVNPFGFSDVTGKFMASGNLVLDENQPQNSKVNITITTANIETGIAALDDILRGSNFFDVNKYTSATFVSNKIMKTGATSGNVYGILTIRGISKPVMLSVTLNKVGIHPYYEVQAVGFTASAVVKRSDFGMHGYIPGVSDETKLEIEAEAEIAKQK
jgi:polyisoprenoid-binding protein YceI